jgi:hypothetical protein
VIFFTRADARAQVRHAVGYLRECHEATLGDDHARAWRALVDAEGALEAIPDGFDCCQWAPYTRTRKIIDGYRGRLEAIRTTRP